MTKLALFKEPTCSLILRSSSMRYKVRAALSSVRGSTNTAGSTKPWRGEREGGKCQRKMKRRGEEKEGGRNSEQLHGDGERQEGMRHEGKWGEEINKLNCVSSVFDELSHICVWPCTVPSSFLGGSLQAVLHMLTNELKYLSKLSSVFLSSRASALNWDQSKAFLSGSYTTPNDDTVR